MLNKEYDMVNAPTDTWMETFTGRRMNPLAPKVEDIDIYDIAQGLSLQCRYGGHIPMFYSVAEHSVRVSRILPRELALWGLLHDAPEAYIADMIRPLKRTKELGEPYLKIEDRLMETIAERYGLSLPMPKEVKEADNIILFTEKRDVKQSKLVWTAEADFEPLAQKIEPWSWTKAKYFFLDEFYRLYNEKLDSQADGVK